MVKTIDHFMDAAAARADAAAARAGEEIVAAQWFYPQDRWKNPMTVMRLVRGVVGRRRVDDRFPMMNVLLVTPARVVVFAVENTWQNPMHLADELASWPRSGITGTQKRVEHSGSGNMELPCGAGRAREHTPRPHGWGLCCDGRIPGTRAHTPADRMRVVLSCPLATPA